jgi:hypothetical protein
MISLAHDLDTGHQVDDDQKEHEEQSGGCHVDALFKPVAHIM